MESGASLNKSHKYQHGILRANYGGLVVSGYIGTGPNDAKSVKELSDVRHVSAEAAHNEYILVNNAKAEDNADINAAVEAAENESPASGTTWPRFWNVEAGLINAKPPNKGKEVRLCIPDIDAEWARQQPRYATTLPYEASPGKFDPITIKTTISVKVRGGFAKFFSQLLEKWAGDSTPGPVGPAFDHFEVTIDLRLDTVHGYYRELIQGPSSGAYGPGPIHSVYCRKSNSTLGIHRGLRAAVAACGFTFTPLA